MIVILIVIATSIWVYFDAKKIGIKKGQIQGIANMGPGGWLAVCLLLWIVGFPVYLAKRGEFKRINSQSPPPSPQGSYSPTPSQESHGFDEQLRKLAKLRDDGVISQEDFEKKKKDLLGI